VSISLFKNFAWMKYSASDQAVSLPNLLSSKKTKDTFDTYYQRTWFILLLSLAGKERLNHVGLWKRAFARPDSYALAIGLTIVTKTK